MIIYYQAHPRPPPPSTRPGQHGRRSRRAARARAPRNGPSGPPHLRPRPYTSRRRRGLTSTWTICCGRSRTSKTTTPRQHRGHDRSSSTRTGPPHLDSTSERRRSYPGRRKRHYAAASGRTVCRARDRPPAARGRCPRPTGPKTKPRKNLVQTLRACPNHSIANVNRVPSPQVLVTRVMNLEEFTARKHVATIMLC
ncbi:uncharacterized protein LOC127751609 [Frankliniella occidentalis]|uniref:Uncharacterized protein LOC127751609 n=1 Tax=Frankliniella occidentalis TaxID=133901 RepID=A0A9C6XUI9_FRAOC|nr:uncharacterized protein LOC127751609 [Frankliniella occidentalis]